MRTKQSVSYLTHDLRWGKKVVGRTQQYKRFLSLWNNKHHVHHNHFGRMKRNFEHLNSWGKKVHKQRIYYQF